MFGRHDDVIKQDQKRDADVPLPDSAMDALVAPPAQGSETDSPAPATSSPPAETEPEQQPETPLYSTSVDGFSAPAGNLTNPLNYSPVPAPPSSGAQPSDDTTVSDQPEPDMEPIELSSEGTDNTAYMDRLTTAETADGTGDEAAVPAQQPADEAPADDTPADTNAAAEEPEPTEPVDQPLQTDDSTAADDPQDQTSSDDQADDDVTDANDDTPPSPEDLLSLKQEALQELSPLVNKLNLGPEEKFRTLMMLIQASDNQDLLGEAHAAAKSIEDEKTRAQALLDIVNEINYFTTKDSKES